MQHKTGDPANLIANGTQQKSECNDDDVDNDHTDDNDHPMTLMTNNMHFVSNSGNSKCVTLSDVFLMYPLVIPWGGGGLQGVERNCLNFWGPVFLANFEVMILCKF